MGEMIEFPSNGTTGQGYLATPEGGTGPGVVVIQEWWGLVDHIKRRVRPVRRRGVRGAGPRPLPGKTATEPDEAAKEMMAMQFDRAAARHERSRGRAACAEQW